MSVYEIELDSGEKYQIETDEGNTPVTKKSILPDTKKIAEKGNWIGAGLQQTGQELFGIPAAHFINQAALNLPRAIANKAGYQYPEAQSPGGNILAKSAGLVGMAVSPIGKAIQGLGKLGEGMSVGQKVLQAAKVGAIGGAAYTPTEDIVGIPQRIAQGVTGAALGSLGMVTANFPKLVNFGGKKTAQAIAEKADKGFNSLAQGLSQKYDELFAGIKGTTKVDDVLGAVDEAIAQFPEGTNVGKLGTISKRLTELKTAGKEISASELHSLKQEISKSIPRSVWNGTADGDGMTNAREQIYWQINKNLEELGGDKYKGLTAEYKGFKQAERLAKRMFYKNGVPSNAPAGNPMDIPTQKAIRDLSSQLPPKEKFAQDFEAWRRGQPLKKVAMGGGAITLGDYLIRRSIGGALNRGQQR